MGKSLGLNKKQSRVTPASFTQVGTGQFRRTGTIHRDGVPATREQRGFCCPCSVQRVCPEGLGKEMTLPFQRFVPLDATRQRTGSLNRVQDVTTTPSLLLVRNFTVRPSSVVPFCASW